MVWSNYLFYSKYSVLAIKDIFHRIDMDQEYKYDVYITYVEIYN